MKKKFSDIVDTHFSFLSCDYGYEETLHSDHLVTYASKRLVLSFDYDDLSGSVGVIVILQEAPLELSLEDIADVYSGEFRKYMYGLEAFDSDVLENCMLELSSKFRKHLDNLLRADKHEIEKISLAHDHATEALMEEYEYGGYRNRAQNAWVNLQYPQYLEIMSNIPDNIKTRLEKIRCQIAQIKSGTSPTT